MPSQHYQGWFEPLKFVSFEANVLTVGVPNKFYAGYFDQHYAAFLMKAVGKEFGAGIKLQYKLFDEPASNQPAEPLLRTAAEAPKNVPNSIQQRKPQPALKSQLIPRYTFNNFVEGDSNKLSRSIGLLSLIHI